MDNDTLIPEMQNQGLGSMYSRSSNAANGGTYIPGMHVNAPGAEPEETAPRNDNPFTPPMGAPARPAAPAGPNTAGQSVVGFLYSVSRKGLGEFWPLHLGSNTIGRSDANEIQLKELTVSDNHAVINIKKMKSTGKMIASVRDAGSKNGMFLNDEELDYDNHPCKNGDIITVGNNYQLLFILINAEEYGLKVSEDFQAVKDTPSTPWNRQKPIDPSSTVSLGGEDDDFGGGTQML